ncbi:hypothetical protein BSNK01_05790 [Bacillaceae bacterium]
MLEEESCSLELASPEPDVASLDSLLPSELVESLPDPLLSAGACSVLLESVPAGCCSPDAGASVWES